MSRDIRDYAIPGQSFRKELIRKVIHLTIALVPTLANWNFWLTVLPLSSGIVFYVINETARIRGQAGGFISRMTVM